MAQAYGITRRCEMVDVVVAHARSWGQSQCQGVLEEAGIIDPRPIQYITLWYGLRARTQEQGALYFWRGINAVMEYLLTLLAAMKSRPLGRKVRMFSRISGMWKARNEADTLQSTTGDSCVWMSVLGHWMIIYGWLTFGGPSLFQVPLPCVNLLILEGSPETLSLSGSAAVSVPCSCLSETPPERSFCDLPGRLMSLVAPRFLESHIVAEVLGICATRFSRWTFAGAGRVQSFV
jgi:hypothetical protein